MTISKHVTSIIFICQSTNAKHFFINTEQVAATCKGSNFRILSRNYRQEIKYSERKLVTFRYSDMPNKETLLTVKNRCNLVWRFFLAFLSLCRFVKCSFHITFLNACEQCSSLHDIALQSNLMKCHSVSAFCFPLQSLNIFTKKFENQVSSFLNRFQICFHLNKDLYKYIFRSLIWNIPQAWWILFLPSTFPASRYVKTKN